MKRKLWQLRLVFIPTVALGLLFVAFPYFTFGLYPRTTILVYLGVMIFLSLLRLKGSYTNKTLDQVVTILIWIISIPVFVIIGIPSFFFSLVIPYFLYEIMYFFAITVLFVFGVRLEIIGKLPERQSIVIYNHCSTIDDVINLAIMGYRFQWKVVYAPEIVRIPFVKFFLKYIGIPLARTNPESREEVKEALKEKADNKYNILILPEGKRLRVEKKGEYILPFNVGAFRLSQTTGIPIVPVVVSWTFLFKPRSGQWWFSPRTIKIFYFDPIFIGKDENINQFRERIRSLMIEKLIELQNNI